MKLSEYFLIFSFDSFFFSQSSFIFILSLCHVCKVNRVTEIKKEKKNTEPLKTRSVLTDFVKHWFHWGKEVCFSQLFLTKLFDCLKTNHLFKIILIKSSISLFVLYLGKNGCGYPQMETLLSAFAHIVGRHGRTFIIRSMGTASQICV